MLKFALAGLVAGSFCFGSASAGEYSEARSVFVYKTDEYLSDYVTKNSISNVVELEIDPDGEAVFLDEIVVRISSGKKVFSAICAIAEKSDGVKREDEHRTIAKTEIGDSEFIVLKDFDLGAFDETIRIEISGIAGKIAEGEEEVSISVLEIKLVPQNSEVELAIINMEETFSIDNSREIDLSENIKAEARISQSLKIKAKKGNLSLDKIFLRNMGGKIEDGAYLEINDGQYDISISEIGIGSCELMGTPVYEGVSVKIQLFDRSGEKLEFSKYFENDDDLVVYSSIFSGHRVSASLKN